MDALLQLMSCFLNAIMYMILIYYFLPFKLQFKEITILFTILSTNMFLINKVGNYGVIFLLISVSIYLMFIRKNRFINIMSFVISYLFIVIFDQFFSLLWNVFVCPISTLLKNTIYYILYVISAIVVLLIICPFIGKYYHLLIRKIEAYVNKQLFVLIGSNLGICLIIVLFNVFIGEYIGYTSRSIGFNCILFACYFIISTILIINITKQNEKRIELEKRQEAYQHLQEYTNQIEHMYSTLRSFKHDYSNMMLTMAEYIASEDINGLKNYFTNEFMPKNQKLTSDTTKINSLINLKDIELKSLLSAKLLYALNLGINVEIEIIEEISHIQMDIIDLAREMQPQLSGKVHYGINASDDAFYGETEEWIQKLSGLGCLNVEMESSALYTVCHRRKKRAAMISAVSGNLVTGDVIYENVNEGLVKGWDEEIKIVLEAIYRFEQKLQAETI